jgi:hypothetical protein
MRDEELDRANRLESEFRQHIGEPYAAFAERGLWRLANSFVEKSNNHADNGFQQWWIGRVAADVQLVSHGIVMSSPSLYFTIRQQKTSGFSFANALLHYGLPATDENIVYDTQIDIKPRSRIPIECARSYGEKSELLRRAYRCRDDLSVKTNMSVAFGTDAGLLLLNPWRYQARLEKGETFLNETREEGKELLEALLGQLSS